MPLYSWGCRGLRRQVRSHRNAPQPGVAPNEIPHDLPCCAAHHPRVFARASLYPTEGLAHSLHVWADELPSPPSDMRILLTRAGFKNNARGSTGARGLSGHALTPLGPGTWWCCSGRGSTIARGMR